MRLLGLQCKEDSRTLLASPLSALEQDVQPNKIHKQTVVVAQCLCLHQQR